MKAHRVKFAKPSTLSKSATAPPLPLDDTQFSKMTSSKSSPSAPVFWAVALAEKQPPSPTALLLENSVPTMNVSKRASDEIAPPVKPARFDLKAPPLSCKVASELPTSSAPPRPPVWYQARCTAHTFTIREKGSAAPIHYQFAMQLDILNAYTVGMII